MNLEQKFCGLHRLVSARPKDAAMWWAVLENLYEGREYHNLAHIEHGLNVLDNLGFDEIDSTFLYAWFTHDAIQGADAELRSYQLTVPMIGYPSSRIEKLHLATKHDKDKQIGDYALMCDMDLAILGEDPERYALFEKQIRGEYSQYSDEEFRQGRSDVLKIFLNRENVYHTAEFSKHYDSQARENLNWALEMLNR